MQGFHIDLAENMRHLYRRKTRLLWILQHTKSNPLGNIFGLLGLCKSSPDDYFAHKSFLSTFENLVKTEKVFFWKYEMRPIRFTVRRYKVAKSQGKFGDTSYANFLNGKVEVGIYA